MKTKFEKTDDWIKVPVNLKVYPLQSVHSSGYAFMDRAHVRLEEEKKDQVAVWLKPKNDKPKTCKSWRWNFPMNFLIMRIISAV